VKPLQSSAALGVVLDKKGALPVADDFGNVVWRVTSRR